MATPHMILQMFLFLIMQNKSQTKSMMLWTNSTSLQKLLKIDFKKAKKAKLGYMSYIVYYLLPWQQVM